MNIKRFIKRLFCKHDSIISLGIISKPSDCQKIYKISCSYECGAEGKMIETIEPEHTSFDIWWIK